MGFSLVPLLLSTCIGVSLCLPRPMPQSQGMTRREAQRYFENYGFMGSSMPDPEIADLVHTDMDKAFEMAYKIFQMRYGLAETGTMDSDTLELMSMPRCGLKDILTMEDTGMSMRKRRYVLTREKWEKKDLTYKVSQYPRDQDLDVAEVDDAFVRAFKVWSDVTPLTFRKLPFSSTEIPDIDIRFSTTGPFPHQGDNYPFDGPSGTLAHAFFPQSGQIGGDSHFDEAEKWTVYTYDGINLFQVAAHEFGHALGLAHSRDPSALMAPFYAGYKPNFVLPTDDVMGIQALYGMNEGPKEPTTTPSPTHQPPTMIPEGRELCEEATFDTITTLEDSDGNKNIYGFKGEYYFLINENQGIAHGYPRLIRDDFPSLPTDLDAALFWDRGWRWNIDISNWEWKEATTFFFKGSYIWEVEDKIVVRGPYAIDTQFRGLPSNIDAAFVFKPNGNIYFTKGDQYYRFTQGVGIDATYPRTLRVWAGLPETVDAALQTPSGKTIFFSGNQYYLYDDYSFNVQPGYPKYSKDDWFNCQFSETSEREHRHHHGHGKHHRIPNLRDIQ